MGFLSPLAFPMNADPRILHSLSSDLTFLESVVRLELAQPVLANKLQGLNKQVGIFPRSNLSGFGGIENLYESRTDDARVDNTPRQREEILLGAIYAEDRAVRLVRQVGLEYFDTNVDTLIS